MSRRRGVWIVLLICGAALGCQSKLSRDVTYKLSAGTIQTVDIDSPRYEQRVTATVESDQPVTVYLYLKKDREPIEKDLELKQKTDRALASWTGSGTGTLEATVPPKQEAILRIESMKTDANVKVKIVGK